MSVYICTYIFNYLHSGENSFDKQNLPPDKANVCDSDYQLTPDKPTGSHFLQFGGRVPHPACTHPQKRELVADFIREEGRGKRGTKLRMTTPASVCRWIAGQGLQPSKEWRGIIKYHSCWRLSIRNYQEGFRGLAARARCRPAETRGWKWKYTKCTSTQSNKIAQATPAKRQWWLRKISLPRRRKNTLTSCRLEKWNYQGLFSLTTSISCVRQQNIDVCDAG